VMLLKKTSVLYLLEAACAVDEGADVVAVYCQLHCCRRERLGLPHIYDTWTQIPKGSSGLRHYEGKLHMGLR
jgi:hypothetical protein